MSYALKRRSEAASAAFDGRKAPRGSMTGLATRPAPVEFESFPEEIVSRILSFLDPPTLCALEAASPFAFHASIRTLAWQKVVSTQLPELSQTASLVRMDGAGRDVDDMAYGPVPICDTFMAPMRKKRLNSSLKRFALAVHAAMCRPPDKLLQAVHTFSSFDNYEEDPNNTLLPSEGVPPSRVRYWSSSGSPDRDSDEFIEYRLQANVCLVDSITITPYRACFQEGNPIYAPRSVRVLTVKTDPNRKRHRYGQRGELPEVFTERKGHVLDVKNVARPQTLRFDPPLISAGGLVVLLEGRQQVQDCDGLYYTCLASVSAHGWILPASQREFHYFIQDGVLEGEFACRTSYPPMADASVRQPEGLSEDVTPEPLRVMRRRIPVDLIIPDELRFLLQQHWDAEALESEQNRMTASDPAEDSPEP